MTMNAGGGPTIGDYLSLWITILGLGAGIAVHGTPVPAWIASLVAIACIVLWIESTSWISHFGKGVSSFIIATVAAPWIGSIVAGLTIPIGIAMTLSAAFMIVSGRAEGT